MAGSIIPGEFRQNTAVWGFNRFRTDALVALLDDLVDVQDEGLPETRCIHVKKALAKVVNKATAIPDKSWLRNAIWHELQKFEQLYGEWNDYEGDGAEEYRRKRLERMRNARWRIAKRVRTKGHIIANDLDLKVIDDIYDAFGSLAKSVPEVFTNLSRAVERYFERRADASSAVG